MLDCYYIKSLPITLEHVEDLELKDHDLALQNLWKALMEDSLKESVHDHTY